MASCPSCDATHHVSTLQPLSLQHVIEDVRAGEAMPAGTCPRCQGLCYLMPAELLEPIPGYNAKRQHFYRQVVDELLAAASAVNLSAVVHGWAEACRVLIRRELRSRSTEEINQHLVSKAYTAVCCRLSGLTLSTESQQEVHNIFTQLIQSQKEPG
jgi:hypothetical protein